MDDDTQVETTEVNQRKTEFEEAAQQPDVGLVTEFWLFLRENKKWWMAPLIASLLLLGLLSLLAASGAAPFIYTLF